MLLAPAEQLFRSSLSVKIAQDSSLTAVTLSNFTEEATVNRVSQATFATIFYGLVFISGVLGNLFVVILIGCCIKIKVATNVYILNLSIADLFFLVWIPFVIIRTAVGQWIWGLAMCKLYFIGTTVNQFGSVAFLTALSVDRYLTVCNPIKTRCFRSVGASVAIVCFCWIIVSILMMPVFLYASTVYIVHELPPLQQHFKNQTADDNYNDVISENDYEIQCMIHWPTDQTSFWNRTTFTIYSAFFGYFLPLFVIWSLYGKVLRKLIQCSRATEQRLINLKSKKRIFRKVTIMVLVVVTSYSICWLPFWIVQFLIELLDENTLMKHRSVFEYSSLVAYCLQYTNSALNPLLYTFASGTFTKQVSRTNVNKRYREALSFLEDRDILEQLPSFLGVSQSLHLLRGDPSKVVGFPRIQTGSLIQNESASRNASLYKMSTITEEENNSDTYL